MANVFPSPKSYVSSICTDKFDIDSSPIIDEYLYSTSPQHCVSSSICVFSTPNTNNNVYMQQGTQLYATTADDIIGGAIKEEVVGLKEEVVGLKEEIDNLKKEIIKLKNSGRTNVEFGSVKPRELDI